MARIVAAFGTSHSTMLFSSAEHWQALFDHVDCKAPISDFEGAPRSYDELLAMTPPTAAANIARDVIAQRHAETEAAMNRLESNIANAKLDALIVIGDDQREIFKDDLRPAIGIYYGDTIRNAAAPTTPTNDWYLQDQRRRLEDGQDRLYPCHSALGAYLIAGLSERNFDITAVKNLTGEQFEGHAYSFVHRRLMRSRIVPMVPVFLNTYYPPNQPGPRRCFDLGAAIRELVESFPENFRVGILASGGLSHFLVNEALDNQVVSALRSKDHEALKALPINKLQTGSSEIRNWITVAAAADGLVLDWITYVPGYRSRAMTGVGLCFAHWR